MFKYYTGNQIDILLSFNSPHDLFSLVMQISDEITLMFNDKNYQYFIDPVKYAENKSFYYAKSKSISYKNNPDINYADHGFFNLALSKVRFIYSFSKMILELHQQNDVFKNLVISNNYAINSMCKALDTFSQWKTLHRQKEMELHGKNFGSATSFVQWIPNEYSKQLQKEIEK